MKYLYDIPASFWGLFRSVNRDIYIEALLAVYDEYQYNNYFLSREFCIQILSDLCSSKRLIYEREEEEGEEDIKEIVPRRILNWLLRAGWLRRTQDYSVMTVNIVIPDYAAVFLEAFDQLVNKPFDEAQVYIQNVYATLFSFQNDSRMNIAMLKTALINTKKLNKALQDMLHNMDLFFERLLAKQEYGELLREHLEGYVEEIVKKKYHILKTSDNFYIYKMDIKNCLKSMREDEEWLERIKIFQERTLAEERKQKNSSKKEDAPYIYRSKEEDAASLIDQIERGFDDIENRIANMDREHSKYIRATVSRLNYLLSGQSDRKGLLVQLIHQLSDQGDKEKQEERIGRVAARMNFSSYDILAENPLYKRRMRKQAVAESVLEQTDVELSREEVLRLNKIHQRFTKQQIEEFIETHMVDGTFCTENITLESDEDFEKLILSYDLAVRRNSRYKMTAGDHTITDGNYTYPSLVLIRKEE